MRSHNAKKQACIEDVMKKNKQLLFQTYQNQNQQAIATINSREQ